MGSSLRSAYNCYVEQHGQSLSFASFKKIRPHTVLPFTTLKFRECLCEYCVNVDLKIRAANSHLVSLPHLCIEDRYQDSRLTLCPKELGAEYKKACLDRECPSCGAVHHRDHLRPALDDEAIRCSPATWWRLENAPINATSTRMQNVKKEGLVEALECDLAPFSCHLFNARWQFHQYKLVTSDLPQETVIFCMDFAENFTCRPQDVPRGCHWNNTQCTIHPNVATYKCTECEDPGSVVTDSIVFISSDMQHDHHAVQHFSGKALELLLSEVVMFNSHPVVMFNSHPVLRWGTNAVQEPNRLRRLFPLGRRTWHPVRAPPFWQLARERAM